MSRARSVADLGNQNVLDLNASAGTLKVGAGITFENTGEAQFAGIVTATGGDFSGNVSVGGVLTYEDVTSVDSVGVVTARQGVHIVSAGASIYSPANNELALYTNGSEKVRITSAGNVGIGSTIPTTSLDVAGSATLTGNLGLGYNLASKVSVRPSALDEQGVYIFEGDAGYTGAMFRAQYNQTLAGSNAKLWEGIGVVSGSFTTTSSIFPDGSAHFASSVGIGETSPGAKLQVNQDASDQSGAAAIKAIGTAYGTNKAIHSYMDTSNSNKSLLYLENGSGVVMNVDGAGNVGIGTDSPIGTLHTSGNSADLVGALLENRADAGSSDSVSLNFVLRRAGGFQFGIPAIKAVKENAWTSTPSTINSSLVFSTIGNESSSEQMRIDSAGRLLVGSISAGTLAGGVESHTAGVVGSTTTLDLASGAPGFKSGLSGNNNANQVVGVWFNHGGLNAGIGASRQVTNQWGTDLRFYTHKSTAADQHEVYERLRIYPDGGMRHGAMISDTTNGAGEFFSSGGFISIQNLTFSTSAHCFQVKTGIPTMATRMVIRNDGDLENANNSYTAYSDASMKENIVDANSQWDDIKDLRVRNYNFKEETGHSTHRQIGVIAQELETTSPGLVSDSFVSDDDGNPTDETYKTVNYSVLYMKAVKALQEAMERIETLEASNTDLLARVTALEAQ